ncbi:HAD-like domain-containing protein [Dissophora ornata]|nr:HAD-like domain-containing protein [Dissophora ornata]
MQNTLISFHKSTRLPRLVVTDLDGTLLNPQHTISRRSSDALSHAQRFHDSNSNSNSNGIQSEDSQHPIQIMIASGRSPRSIQKVIDLFEGLMIPDAVICCNGALNYNPRTKVISHPQFIPLDQTLIMVQKLREEIMGYGTSKSQFPPNKNPESNGSEGLEPLKNLQGGADKDGKLQNGDELLMAGRPGFACEVIWFEGMTLSGEVIYAKDTSFICDRTWELQRKHTFYYDYMVVEDTMEAFVQSIQQSKGGSRVGGIIKLMALDRNRTASEVFESLPEILRPQTTPSTSTGGGLGNEPSLNISAIYSGPYFLEIAAAGVNKGLGLAKYCEANEIPPETVVAFGDLLNDAEMLQFAGLGLCMGNGHEDMKRLANRVIGTNAEDGVAREIESWFS